MNWRDTIQNETEVNCIISQNDIGISKENALIGLEIMIVFFAIVFMYFIMNLTATRKK